MQLATDAIEDYPEMKIRVLYVDDDAAMRVAVKGYVESMCNDIIIDTCSSGAEALRRLSCDGTDTGYHAVISDYQMPEMDGIQLLRRLRENESEIPFLIFTGRSREEIAIKALNSGADYYLAKGERPELLFPELIHALKFLVRERWQRNELHVTSQKLRAIMENARATIIVMDLDSNVQYINPAAIETFGWVKEEVIGRQMPWLPDSSDDGVKDRVRDLLLTGKVVRYGGKRKTKEGTYIDCDIMLFPILDSKESVQGMLLMLTGKESATYVVY